MSFNLPQEHQAGDRQLDEAARNDLQLAIKKLAHLDVSKETKDFLLARLYIEFGQNTSAIGQLDALVSAECSVAIAPARRNELRSKLMAAKPDPVPAQTSNSKERLMGLLSELQALRSYAVCGECDTGNGDGFWNWQTPNWVCRGC